MRQELQFYRGIYGLVRSMKAAKFLGRLYLFCMSVTIGLTANAQLCEVDADANQDSLDYKLAYFKGMHLNAVDPVSYFWDFGDGTTSAEQNPAHQFPDSGYYSLVLTITDANGCTDSLTHNMAIFDDDTWGQGCYAEFHDMRDSVDHKTIYFENFSKAHGTVISWNWSFGDGSSSTEMSPYHTYADSGDYEVCLFFETTDGCSDTSCFMIGIYEGYNPGGGGPCQAGFGEYMDPNDPLKVMFSDYSYSNGGMVTDWQWDFGDGQAGSGQSIDHLYTAEGAYNVCLTISDDMGCTHTSCREVWVGKGGSPGGGCYAGFFENPDSANYLNWYFEDNSFSDLGMQTWTWDFGDGMTGQGPQTSHTYTDSGMYVVCIYVSDGQGCDDTLCREIGVFPGAKPGGPGTGPGNCYADFYEYTDSMDHMMMIFNDASNSDAGVSSWLWEFGDGSTSMVQQAEHLYTAEGQYNVCLTIEDTTGCRHQTCRMVYIGSGGGPGTGPGNCYADFYEYTDSMDHMMMIFNDASYSDAGVSSWLWEFGDGSTSMAQQAEHLYTAEGEYNACLTIEDTTGCRNQICRMVYVGSGGGPGTGPGGPGGKGCMADFGEYPDGMDYKKWFFHDYSWAEQGVEIVEWSFGDGATSRMFTPEHIYQADGEYEVCLKMMSFDGCSDTLCRMIYVDPNGGPMTGPDCWAEFMERQDTGNYLTFHFKPDLHLKDKVAKWYWEFGDGTADSIPNPSHTYADSGEYTVCLNIVDTSGCESGNCHIIYALKDMSGFKGCAAKFEYQVDGQDSLAYNFKAVGSSNISGGFWDFGDGGTSHEAQTRHIFPGAGFYNVCVTVWDDSTGCQNNYCEIIEVAGGGTESCFGMMQINFVDSLTVSFTDLSKGDITEWFWEFGDGKVSYGQHPVHTFDWYGFYDVCLTVKNANTGCWNRVCNFVELRDPNGTAAHCLADFRWFPSSNNPYFIHFDDASQGMLTDWRWDFGDGTFANGPKVSHQFNAPGFHSVCLTVFDAGSGCQNMYCKDVEVIDTNVTSCWVDFNFFKAPSSFKVEFKDQSQGSFTDYYWEFGNGKFSNSQNPVHTYSAPGFYDVCLSAYDSTSGCQGHFCRPVEIRDSNSVICRANFSFFPDANKDVHFTDKSEGNFAEWYWEFGDGTFSHMQNPVHHYNAGGYYWVCLSVFDPMSGCQQTYCADVNIVDSNSVVCRSDFSYTRGIGNKILFKEASTGTLTNYRWEFGDGTFGKGKTPSHTYQYPGYYYVCLSVYDSISGCQDFFCKDLEVVDTNATACKANYTFYKDANNSVYFTDASKGTFTEWFWDFGNGKFSYMQNPVHKYDRSGYYWACLSVRDPNSGCQDMYCQEIEIIDTNTVSCKAAFGSFIDDNSTAFFNDKSTGTFTDWRWEFGDGSFGSGPNVSHYYREPGLYKVCLGVFDANSGCQNRICKDIEIIDQNLTYCKPSFTFFIDQNGRDVQFTDKTQGSVTEWFWDFGNGKFSHDKNPKHYYNNPGYYHVCLSVYDSVSGCQNVYCNPVDIIDTLVAVCKASYTYFPDANNDVHFTDKSEGNFTDYYWEFGDGTFSHSMNPVHRYPGAGFYTVCLSVFDPQSGCQDRYCERISIVDTNTVVCDANFTLYKDANNTVFFKDASKGQFTNFFWDFGDGTFSHTRSPSHMYQNQGYYSVCLSVLDTTSGCQDVYCKDIEIIDTNTVSCKAEFSFFRDSSDNIRFKNASEGSLTNNFWDFGDATTSNELNPVHKYTASGYYKVCLSVYDANSGCQDMRCKFIEYIDTTTSKVSCSSSFTFFVDENKNARFKQASKGNVSSWRWDFGDGTFGRGQEVTRTYTKAGLYNVCLTVFDEASGCQDTYCSKVEIIDNNVANCVAGFTHFVDTTGLGVKFKNASKGNYTDIFWNFGDGGYSHDANPAHNYKAGGIYAVCLTVFDTLSGCMNSFCTDVELKDQVTVFCKAGYKFFVDDSNSAHFQNLSKGTYTKLYWDFGDGTFSTDANPSHKYEKTGVYRACLSIKDPVSGCQNTYCDFVQIITENEVVCNAKYTIYRDPNARKVHFKDGSTGDLTNWRWSFGDGTFSKERYPSHEYTQDGYYEVCLAVYDSVSGCHNKYCSFVEVIDTNTVACASFFTYFPEGFDVTFENEAQGSFSNMRWDFGDGNVANTASPAHTYEQSGFYRVCLTVFDSTSGCQDRYCDFVEILDTVSVMCNANYSFITDDARKVYFRDESKGTFAKWFWEFGDGYVSTDQNPEHVYKRDGVYNVCLSVFDPNTGCKATFCDFVEVIDTNTVTCNAYFTYYPDDKGDVHFTNESMGAFDKVRWTFGDRTASIDANPVHTYQAAGYYKVCVTTFDSASGCISTYCDEIQVGDNSVLTNNCKADFKYYPEGKEVYFENLSKGNYKQVMWDFGDGFNSNSMSPKHAYKQSGYYEVCLAVFDSTTLCYNYACKTVSVIDSNDLNCSASFKYFVEPGTNKVNFSDISFGDPVSWYWDMGDNQVAVKDQSPVYTYTASGYYRVCLTIETSLGCQESYCDIIEVGDVSNSCFSYFTYYADSATATAYFNNETRGEIASYEWNFGDGFVSVQEQPAHTYADTGKYAVCLTVVSTSGCTSTWCENVRVGNALSDPCLFSCVWPGDANSDLEANHYDVLVVGLNYGETGPKREDASDRWIGQYAQDWSTWQWDGVNNKHGDCDGDGLINDNDLIVIDSNFAYSHPYNPPGREIIEDDLYFEILTDSIYAGGIMEIAVLAGKDKDATMYGIGFELNFGPNFIQSGTVTTDFTNSWLGASGTDMITFANSAPSTGDIFVALTRNDQQDKTGKGELARISFMVSDNIESPQIKIELTTEGGLNAKGDTVKFQPSPSDTVVVNGINDQYKGFEVQQIKLYPNPTTGSVGFDLPNKNHSEHEIRIFTTNGQMVYSGKTTANGKVNLDLSELTSGMYIVKISSREEKVTYIDRLSLQK